MVLRKKRKPQNQYKCCFFCFFWFFSMVFHCLLKKVGFLISFRWFCVQVSCNNGFSMFLSRGARLNGFVDVYLCGLFLMCIRHKATSKHTKRHCDCMCVCVCVCFCEAHKTWAHTTHFSVKHIKTYALLKPIKTYNLLKPIKTY